MNRVPPLLLAALVIGVGGRATASSAGQWRPASTNAVSITGPITLWSDRIAMTGATLKLVEVAQPASFKTDQGDFPARVYGVVKPRPLKLMNGNTFCGDKAVTWIVAQPTAPAALQLLTYTGPDRPTSEQTPGLCGIYYYVR